MRESGTIEARGLRPAEVREAVDVLARGMRDNPLHVAAYGQIQRAVCVLTRA